MSKFAGLKVMFAGLCIGLLSAGCAFVFDSKAFLLGFMAETGVRLHFIGHPDDGQAGRYCGHREFWLSSRGWAAMETSSSC